MTWFVVTAGLALGLGMCLVLAWWSARKPSLEARVAPFVPQSVADRVRRREAVVTPLPAVERLLAPVVRDLGRLLAKVGSPAIDVERRLRRAGSALSVEQFRAQQVVWAVAGLALASAAAVTLALFRGAGLVPLAVLVGVAVVGAVAARDALLTRAVRRRERRLLEELPTIAELLALSVAAGESALGALERVARVTSGAMSDEIRIALADVRAGARLPAALDSMAADSGVPALRHFAEGVATAVERGTPLAEVLRAQAQDVRAHGREALIEAGGRREIAMMIPVVFLILPVTVVFAIFPGLVAINLGG